MSWGRGGAAVAQLDAEGVGLHVAQSHLDGQRSVHLHSPNRLKASQCTWDMHHRNTTVKAIVRVQTKI